MVYIIVEFTDDQSTDVVPESWLQDGLCPWDPSNLYQSAVKGNIPRPSVYELLPARKIGPHSYGNHKK